MRLNATMVLPALLLLGGCATERYYGGIYSSSTPEVTLVAATVTDDSPAWGYPLIPFPLPIYPLALARAGLTDEVTVRLVIDKDGYVKNATILKYRFKELADSVLNATSRWRFREFSPWRLAEPKGLIVDCRLKFSIE